MKQLIKSLTKILLLPIGIMSTFTHADKWVIGVEEIDYFPYYHLVDSQYHGFAREFFDAFAVQYGHEFTYRPLPIKRLYQELLDQKIDFKFPDHPHWGKSEKGTLTVHYSEPVVGFTDGVLILPSREQLSLERLKSIGYVRGFSPWTLLDKIESGKIQSRQINTLNSLIKLVLDGHIDGAYFNVSVARSILKEQLDQPEALTFASQLPHDRNNYRLSSMRHSKVLSQLSDFLVTDKAQSIRKKYGLTVYP